MDIMMWFLLVVVICLLIFISWIWPPHSPWAPWWRTRKKTALAAFKMSGLKKGQTVFELGSGEATALIVASEEFEAKGVGIEIDPARYYLSRFTVWRKRLENEIKLVRGDLFKENLHDADVIYVYLVPKSLNKLIPKFKKELKKGTKIISFRYEMKLPLKKFDKENDLRMYII